MELSKGSKGLCFEGDRRSFAVTPWTGFCDTVMPQAGALFSMLMSYPQRLQCAYCVTCGGQEHLVLCNL